MLILMKQEEGPSPLFHYMACLTSAWGPTCPSSAAPAQQPSGPALHGPSHDRQDGLPDRQHSGLSCSPLLLGEHACVLLHLVKQNVRQLVVIRALGQPFQDGRNSDGMAEVLQQGIPEACIFCSAVKSGQTSLRGTTRGERGSAWQNGAWQNGRISMAE